MTTPTSAAAPAQTPTQSSASLALADPALSAAPPTPTTTSVPEQGQGQGQGHPTSPAAWREKPPAGSMPATLRSSMRRFGALETPTPTGDPITGSSGTTLLQGGGAGAGAGPAASGAGAHEERALFGANPAYGALRVESELSHRVVVVPVRKTALMASARDRSSTAPDSPKAAAKPKDVAGTCARVCDGDVPFKPGTVAYQLWLGWSTLGIIYGDIGTSPLYTYSSILGNVPGGASEDNVLGALSLMLWTMILVVGFKYITFVFMADDHGEGGTFAIYALLSRGFRERFTSDAHFHTANTVAAFFALVAVGAVLADGILTPAISVLGAIAGLKVLSADAAPAVVPVSCVIIALLYLVQWRGTARVSLLFSPIIALWLVSLAGIGIYNFSQNPSVFAAFSPAYGINWLVANGYDGWASLRSVFLTITGTEAMYADLGHFNKLAVRSSASLFVLPCLMMCYLGQAAALIQDPTVVTNTFFLGVPPNARIYMVILSTLAAVIASQAMITASFSIINQAIRLHCFPRLTVKHTGKYEFGQVYVPEINYFFMVLTIIVIAGYQDATALGYAYGVAVSLVMFLTTIFFSLVVVFVFHRHWVLAVAFLLVFGAIDSVFLSANLLKFTSGGWFSVTVAVVFTLILVVWRWGRLRMIRAQAAMSLEDSELFHVPIARISPAGTLDVSVHEDRTALLGKGGIEAVDVESGLGGEHADQGQGPDQGEDTAVSIIPGRMMIVYSSSPDKVPASLAHFLRRIPARPEHLIFVTVTAVNVPYVLSEVTVTQVAGHERVYRASINYGYAESAPSANEVAVNLIRLLDLVPRHRFPDRDPSDEELFDAVDPTFMIGHDSVRPEGSRGGVRGLAYWTAVEAFALLLGASRSAAFMLRIPIEKLLEVGVIVKM